MLVIIPARGGSKGIPRKNLRALAGRPLIAYAIEIALRSRHTSDVVVSSEDPEILNLALKLGAQIHRRAESLSGDATTLDQVVLAAYQEITTARGHEYDVVVTLQPTSPLLTTASLDQAIDELRARPDVATLLSATDDTHLRWKRAPGGFRPLYSERLNRQYLEPTFRETGGLIACRGATIATGSRIGQPATLLLVSGAEAIDIDSREDWALCEWYLRHRDILFVVAGYPAIGLGHVYNALTIANELVAHRVRFLVTHESALAHDAIAAYNYEVHQSTTTDIVSAILDMQPDVVINDRLDTDESEIDRLKQARLRVINFEDLGTGATRADLVINAIYPETEELPNHYFGPQYFCPRAEFVLTRPRPVSDAVGRVLITFGGVDPSNLTYRVVDAIYAASRERGILLEVILGRGYGSVDSLAPYSDLEVHALVADMADHIRAADLVFTSAGRTVFEIACLGTPAIVLSQNARELTHFYASEEYGFLNLGLGQDASADLILANFLQLIDSSSNRREMQRRMLVSDLRAGTARVVRLIEGTIDRHESG